MEKLITSLDPNFGATLREQLGDNFQKIQNGIDSQSDSLNKQILDMLGDVPLQDKNEVTQARVDSSGKAYSTLKGRLDSQQTSADTALKEERTIGLEVEDARSDSSGETFENLKSRLDSQESKIDNRIDNRLAQISSVPETFTNLDALKNAYPSGRTGIFVTADTGHKYIWANNSWNDAGVYQSVGISNDSITSEMLSGNARDISIYVNNKSGGAVFDIDSINMTLTSSKGYANFGRHSDLIPTVKLKLEFSSNVIYYDFTLKVLGVTDYVFKLTSDQALIGIINQDLSVVDLNVTNYSIDGVDVKTGKINTYIYNNNISGGGKFDINTANKSLVVTGVYINHGTTSELITDTNLSLSNNINVIYYDFANKSLGVTDDVSKVSKQKELIGIINPDLSVFDLKVTNYSIDGVNVKTSVRDKFINHNLHFFGDAIIDIDKKTFTANGVYINYDFGVGRSMPNTTLDVSTNTIVYFDTKDGAVKATDQYNKLKDGQFLLGNFQAGWIQGSFFNSFSRVLVVKNGITYDAAGYKARNALLSNTYMATFGDSITSDQVSGTGTQIMNTLGAKKTGNFATGWSTGSDWHDGTTNTTTVTLTTPNNTDTNDNVLSNQVRRALQYTTASGQQITWTTQLMAYLV